ncbi:MAG: translocation/assembly module TamB domain-containing protein [Caulobacteraceae bacterium]|nr:translocation/assembly module TamB domain-containing protein [Caulobacteraceae bacterium]
MRRRRWRVVAAAAALIILIVPFLFVLALDTVPGHVLIVDVVDRIVLPTGMRFQVTRIEGSIWSRMRLEGLAVRDLKGTFVEVPSVFLDWRPKELLDGRLEVNEVAAPTVRVLRSPKLRIRPPKRNQPTLPKISLILRSLSIRHLDLAPALTGEARSLWVKASGEVLRPKVIFALQARDWPAAGHAGGDALVLNVDAEPDADRLAMTARLNAPAGGAVGRLLRLGQPFDFTLQGRGGWKVWDGRAASNLGGRPLLDAVLSARSGTFGARGRFWPALLVGSGAPELAKLPATFSVTTSTTDGRKFDIDSTVSSTALAARIRGGIDLAHSRFIGLRIGARIASAESVMKGLSGRNVGVGLVLTGDMRQPAYAADVTAASLTVQDLSLQGVHGAAEGRPQGRQNLLSARAQATRITGLPDGYDALAQNVSAQGRFALARDKVSGDISLRSSRLQAGIAVASSPIGGPWNGAINARADRVALPGVGVLNVQAEATVARLGARGMSAAGRVRARSLSLDSPEARDLLGGQADAATDFALSPDGAFSVSGATLTAPKFRLLDAKAQFGTGGALSIAADAVSQAYGPLKLTVSGTRTAPSAHLLAANPKVAGITALDARLTSVAASKWRVQAAARSPYGPLALDADVGLIGNLAKADIRRASVRGLAVSGQVSQTQAGPFSGRLRISGAGLSGDATLSAQQGVQAVDLQLAAKNARLPIDPPLTVASGDAHGRILLKTGFPAVSGAANFHGVRWNGITLAEAKVDGHWDRSGEANLAVKGRGAAPFDFKGHAALSPGLARLTGGGSAGGVPMRLADASEIRHDKSGWRLAPTTVVLPKGRLVLAGQLSRTGLAGSARLEQADLALADGFDPRLGLSGTANGDVSFNLANGAPPTGSAQLQITHFARASLTQESEPVDIAVLASLTAREGLAHAVVRRGGAVVGRFQASLGPFRSEGDFVRRIQTAPLHGGIRWNGPAEALWSLAGFPGQSLGGSLWVGADVSGTVDQPTVVGLVKGQGLKYSSASVGTTIDDINLDGRFEGARLQIARLTGRAGSGTIGVSGFVDLSGANGYPIDLKLSLSRARLARSDQVSVTASGELTATNTRKAGALISGKLTLDDASYQLGRPGAEDVPELTGVRRKYEPPGAPISPSDAESSPAGPPSRWKLDVAIASSNHLLVRGMGLSAEWAAALNIRGDIRHPVVVGDITAVRGNFDFAGRRLTLTRGLIHLNGSDPPDPSLDIVASSDVEGVTANVSIAGTAAQPLITFSSTPALPSEEVLARLLFGTSAANISPAQAIELAASINTLRGGGGGPLGRLQKLAHLDRLSFYAADKTTGRAAGVGAGKYVTKNIYLEITTDARGYTATQIEIALRKSLQLLSQVSAVGTSNLSVRFTHNY